VQVPSFGRLLPGIPEDSIQRCRYSRTTRDSTEAPPTAMAAITLAGLFRQCALTSVISVHYGEGKAVRPRVGVLAFDLFRGQ
jgi:hypothetical protein